MKIMNTLSFAFAFAVGTCIAYPDTPTTTNSVGKADEVLIWNDVHTNLFLTVDQTVSPGLRGNGKLVVPVNIVKAAAVSQESQPEDNFRAGNWGEEVAGMRLSIRVDSSGWTNSKTVIATVLLRNVSPSVQYFPLARVTSIAGNDFRNANFEFDVTTPDGLVVRGKQRSFSPLPKELEVIRNTQRKFQVPLNAEFDLTAPGIYRVKAKTLVHGPDKSGLVEIISGETTFMIPPGA